MTQVDTSRIPFDKLTDEQARVELARLKKVITEHDWQYHTKSSPTISDADYDDLRDRNETIEMRFPHLVEKSTAPSRTVGGPLASDATKIMHTIPMLSLTNTYTKKDVMSFLKTVQKRLKIHEADLVTIIAEPKIDGIACSLRYVEGHLVQATTRGDGVYGEDITQNVKMIPDIPHKLITETVPEIIEVRGEIYMTHEKFNTLNEHQRKKGQSVFSTPRNATSGTVRQLDPQVTKDRPLNFFAYAWGDISTAPDPTISDMRARFKSWGFPLNEPHRLCHTLDDILAYYADMQAYRHELPFDIDGLVYKVNDVAYHDQLGYIARAPKWAIAHKWPAKQAVTTLTDISFQVGRTGVLTPIAHLEPVTINGAMISRTTLHNIRIIAQKNIRIGDQVIVSLAGDAIPQIDSVVFSQRPDGTVPFTVPETCPCPKEMPVVMEKDGESCRCRGGLDCPPQQVARLKHAASIHAFTISKLGTKTIEQFWQEGLLKTPVDIFRLHKHADTIQTLPGWGPTSTKTLLDIIERQRYIELYQFIYSLGIEGIGLTVSKNIAKYYQTEVMWFGAMCFASYAREDHPDEPLPRHVGRAYAELCDIEGVGIRNADAICAFYADDANKKLVRDLSNELIQVSDDRGTPTPGSIENMTFSIPDNVVFDIDKSKIVKFIEALGGKVIDTVSSDADYFVHGIEAPDDCENECNKAHIFNLSDIGTEDLYTMIAYHMYNKKHK